MKQKELDENSESQKRDKTEKQDEKDHAIDRLKETRMQFMHQNRQVPPCCLFAFHMSKQCEIQREIHLTANKGTRQKAVIVWSTARTSGYTMVLHRM